MGIFHTGGINAAAIDDEAFFTIYAPHHKATLQQPWQSLRSLSTLVILLLIIIISV